MVKCALSFLVMLALLISPVAATVSVTASQSGADAGSVMGGETFTVSASGWSGSCSSAYLDLTNCPVCSVSESQSKTLSGSSVSWTTISATKANSQLISVSVSGTCSPDSGSASFDVKNPPSLSAELSTSSASVVQGSTFSFNLNLQNSGETTARFGTITVSPSDFSISSGCSPSDIPGAQGAGMSCTVAASAFATTGARTVTLSINPANAGSVTKNIAVTVIASPSSPPENPPAVSSGGGGGGPPDNSKRERNVTGQISPPGLLNNTRLQAAIQNALALGNMSQNAIQNMLMLSNRISGESDVSRTITVEGVQSQVKTTVMYRGNKTARNYIMYEKIPKTFAASTDNITVSVAGAKVEIVEKDPEYAIVFDTVNPNQELSVTYAINRAVSTSTVDSFALEVYAESLVEGVEQVGAGDDVVCAQVITPAKNPATGECREFSTPCDVPEGWAVVVSCEQTVDKGDTLPDDGEKKTNPIYYVLILAVLVVAGYYLYPKIRDRKIYNSFNNI